MANELLEQLLRRAQAIGPQGPGTSADPMSALGKASGIGPIQKDAYLNQDPYYKMQDIQLPELPPSPFQKPQSPLTPSQNMVPNMGGKVMGPGLSPSMPPRPSPSPGMSPSMGMSIPGGAPSISEGPGLDFTTGQSVGDEEFPQLPSTSISGIAGPISGGTSLNDQMIQRATKQGPQDLIGLIKSLFRR
jgi:hypothetical protein